jgi:hypothetical protein
MQRYRNRCTAEAICYMERFDWWLVPVHGQGATPKAPIYRGWQEFRIGVADLIEKLENKPQTVIGLHLGGSGLLDLEGDTPEGEKVLTDLCRGLAFPCWRSGKSHHRLFLAHPQVNYWKDGDLEFRTGNHQSILPPSVLQPGSISYEWLISPFEIAPPTLPDHIVSFYENRIGQEHRRKSERRNKPPAATFPYRDDLDYLLRHFDLKEEAEKAGIEFICRQPDENGNVPCFVPAVLRDGGADESPSGVFNVRNGVLRDFATGRNHRYFRLMEALTGRPWLEIFKEYEKVVGSVAGRPHSRRISLPVPVRSPSASISLEKARDSLHRYFDDNLSRPPVSKRLHIIKGPCGLGKTYTLCQLLGQKATRAIILTLENELASTHCKLLQDAKAKARRMPVLRETECPHPDEYEATSRRGFQASQSLPCRTCRIGPTKCQYLISFGSLTEADQLCCAAVYHTHEGFYRAYGNENRSIVVFDENSIDLLLAPVQNSVAHWRAWGQLVAEWQPRAEVGKLHQDRILALVDWIGRKEQEFVESRDTLRPPRKFQPFSIPAQLQTPNEAEDPGLVQWLNEHAFGREHGHLPNLYSPALYLLTRPDCYVLLEHHPTSTQVRFRKRNPLPDDKEVFILDATANEKLIRAIAPDWNIHVWEPGPVEQKGQVIQIMDYDLSRQKIKKEIANHRPTNPSWLFQVLENILARSGPTPLITFKKMIFPPAPEWNLLDNLQGKHHITDCFNFPCRGRNIDAQTLIVLGTPYKDEAAIWELALAIWGFDGLPASPYQRRYHQRGDFLAGNMGHEETRLRLLQEFLVSADLVQAIGRIRPLQNGCTIYVLSNAPIPDWQITQFRAAELFDLRQPLRKDARANYDAYVQALLELLDKGTWVSNPEVCANIGVAPRTGLVYMERFRQDHAMRLDIGRHRIRWRELCFDDYKEV